MYLWNFSTIIQDTFLFKLALLTIWKIIDTIIVEILSYNELLIGDYI